MTGALVATLAIGVILGRLSGQSPEPNAPATPRAESATPSGDSTTDAETPGRSVGPTGERAGMEVGFARSEAGARAAAVSYATASQRWLYMTDDEIGAALTAIGTPAAAPRLADEVVAEVAVARDGLAASPGRVWWIVRHLAARLDAYTDLRARVSVWTVTVLSAPGVALPQADWLTVTVYLEWHGGDWRVAAVDDEPGPTPMVGVRDQPWQPAPFDDALEGFERVGSEGGS